jgi:hypothetical protein
MVILFTYYYFLDIWIFENGGKSGHVCFLTIFGQIKIRVRMGGELDAVPASVPATVSFGGIYVSFD